MKCYKREIKKKNNMKQEIYICYFCRRNKIVTIFSVLVLVYCLLCSLYKGSEIYNINNRMIKSLGELMYNIGISIVAACIFLVFQSWMYYRRIMLIEQTTKNFIKYHERSTDDFNDYVICRR